MSKTVSTLLGATFALSLAAPALAADEVPMAPFTYGGDETFSYAGGKVGTGVKDPSVCGTVDEDAWLKKYEANLKK